MIVHCFALFECVTWWDFDRMAAIVFCFFHLKQTGQKNPFVEINQNSHMTHYIELNRTNRRLFPLKESIPSFETYSRFPMLCL